MNFTAAQANELQDVLRYVGDCHDGLEEYEEQQVVEGGEFVLKTVRVLTTARCQEIASALPNVPDEMIEDLMDALDEATTDAGDYPGSEEDEYSRMYVEPIQDLVYWKLCQLRDKENGKGHSDS